MSESKPDPLFGQAPRKICPVCGEISYSTAGMHPQCAMQQADAHRVKRLKALRKDAEPTKKT
jgi:hypothetical protein